MIRTNLSKRNKKEIKRKEKIKEIKERIMKNTQK